MAIIDRLKYDATSDDWLVWKWPDPAHPTDEIRLGAQLIVNQSQDALFVKGGEALDLFGPGTHTLSTGNIPLLRKLVNLPFGGKTPFTAEVWFINRHAKRDLRWGTKTPIPLIDPIYNYPVRVRSYGQWGVRVKDSRSLVTQLVGTMAQLSTDKVDEAFSGEICQHLSDALSRYLVERGISVLQVNARLNELAQVTCDELRPHLDRFGLELVNFNVERVSIPEDDMKILQDVLGKRMEIDQVSQAKVGPAYTTMRTFDTLEKAAENEGGVAGNLLAGGLGMGLGVGAGLPVGQQLGQAMSPHPPENGADSDDATVRLEKLKVMLEKKLITQEEFESKKKEILDSI